LKIPRRDIVELIKLCFMNISQFLSDAKLVHAQRPRFDHSVALVQFAVEELGKASILRKKLQETEDAIVEVPDRLFGGRGSHQLKEREAWTILSPELRTLARGAFDPKVFDPQVFLTEDVELSHEERLRSMFVDFDKGVPTLGIAVESELLQKLIEGVEREVEEFKASWVLE
jgi:AbiV family abortive infection protein